MNSNLKYKNWKEVSISDYFKIIDIATDEGIDSMTKDVELIALLYGCDADEIWNKNIGAVSSYKEGLSWIYEKIDFDSKARHFKRIKIDGEPYDVTTDISKMSYSQYVDFQQSWNGLPKDADNMALVLSCFIVPKGKKYGIDYDILELRERIKESVSITVATSLCFFFLKRSVVSIRSFLTYSKWMMRMMKWKARKTLTEKDKEIFQRTIEGLQAMEAQFTVGSR